jgi:hypothetical protein
LSNGPFQDAYRRLIEQERIRRGLARDKPKVYRAIDHLNSPKQIAAHLAKDANGEPARFRAMFAGRRSGKTTLGQHEMVEAATANQGCAVVYVGPTINLAVKTVWEELRQWSAPYGGRAREDLHEIRFRDHGSVIYILGADNKRSLDRIRGIKNICYLWWDEQGLYDSDFALYGLSSCIRPALADRKGRLTLSGTGGPEVGHWFNIVTKGSAGGGDANEESFVVIKGWTMHDNPIIGPVRAEEEIDAACNDRGVTRNDPYIRREYGSAEKGIEFTTDSTLSCFSPIKSRHVDLLPGGRYVLGGDIGSVDFSAVSVKWIHLNYPGIHTVKTEKRKTKTTSEQIAFFKEYLDTYQALSSDKVMLALDPGGGGKAVIEELCTMGSWWDPLPAQKFDKAMSVRLMADDVRSGFMTYEPDTCKSAVEGLQKLEWDPKAVGQKLKGHAPDPADADLYGWRLAKSLYSYEEPVDEIPHDPALDFIDVEEQQLRDAGFI